MASGTAHQRPNACAEFAKTHWCEPIPIQPKSEEDFLGPIYQLKKREVRSPTPCPGSGSCADGCICPKSFEIGEQSPTLGPPKFLLLVGETGTGKSTLINGIVNSFYGVTFESSFRLKLVAHSECVQSNTPRSQAHSQTSIVSVYTLFPVSKVDEKQRYVTKLNCPLTIIDTPGFGATEGLAEDKAKIEKISQVLGVDGRHVPGMTGMLHMIGFVVKASHIRHTLTQRYIFDQILSLFGNDVKPIIMPVFTFADSGKPQALAALEEDQVPHEKFLTFNNGIIYVDNTDKETLLQENPGATDAEQQALEECLERIQLNSIEWKRGERNYQELFRQLEATTEPVTLDRTKEVLKQRRILECCMERFTKSLKREMCELEFLESCIELVGSTGPRITREDAKKSKIMIVSKVIIIENSSGVFATVCKTCRQTCHDNCTEGSDAGSCFVMDEERRCKLCPGRCSYEQHEKANHSFEYYEEEEEITVKKIAHRYGVSTGKSDAKKQIASKMLAELEKLENDFSYNITTINACLKYLEENAMRQYPFTVVDYVDTLIKEEETERRPGWGHRKRLLENAKCYTEILAQSRNGADPFADKKERILKLQKEAINPIREKSWRERFSDLLPWISGTGSFTLDLLRWIFVPVVAAVALVVLTAGWKFSWNSNIIKSLRKLANRIKVNYLHNHSD